MNNFFYEKVFTVGWLKHARVAKLGVCMASAIGVAGQQGFAFDSTDVLPKGVRGVVIKNVDTRLQDKSSDTGEIEPIAEPLSKELTFRKALRGEKSQVKKNLLQGAMENAGYNEDDSLGRFSADITGRVQVTAPIISYGISHQLTFALAVPYYRAATDIDVGFKESQTGRNFIASLVDDERRQYSAALVSYNKISGATSELDDKLIDNGYEPLGAWEDSGFGDTTLALKNRYYNKTRFKAAWTSGLTLPTGRTDDPNILTDIPFGDGTVDAFLQLTQDVPMNFGFMLNFYGKYTYQFKSERKIRLVTEEEPIEGDVKRVRYKLGDKVNAGTSLQYNPDFGMISGVAYEFYNKWGDSYQVTDDAVKDKIEENTYHRSQRVEYLLGYSSVPAFRRKEAKVPFKANLFYSQHISSISMPDNDLVGFDLSLFF